MKKIRETLQKIKPAQLVKTGAFILLLAVAGYFFWQNQKLTAGARELEQLKSAVSRLYELPDETPTLATIVDKEQLQGQELFNRAQNGDKVLIFPQAKKAILYRPSTKKIVEVAPFLAPISPDSPQEQAAVSANTAQSPLPSASTSGTPSPQPTVKVSVLNGTTSVGLAKKYAAELETKVQNLSIASTVQAKKDTYTVTTVSDVSGKNAAAAQLVATALNAQLQPLPEGEAVPDAEIIVVIGSDKQE